MQDLEFLLQLQNAFIHSCGTLSLCILNYSLAAKQINPFYIFPLSSHLHLRIVLSRANVNMKILVENEISSPWWY